LWGLVSLKFLEQGIVLVLHLYYWRLSATPEDET
jgi:hypothetical protein